MKWFGIVHNYPDVFNSYLLLDSYFLNPWCVFFISLIFQFSNPNLYVQSLLLLIILLLLLLLWDSIWQLHLVVLKKYGNLNRCIFVPGSKMCMVDWQINQSASTVSFSSLSRHSTFVSLWQVASSDYFAVITNTYIISSNNHFMFKSQ